MSRIEVIQLNRHYLHDAARLIAQNHRLQREQVSILPDCHENIEVIAEKLDKLWTKVPAVGAFENSRLVGLLSGMVIPSLKGSGRGIYCPEWAHAATGVQRGSLYRFMYEKISDLWVQDGCYTHAITIMAHDQPAVDAWFWNGFGLLTVDVLRDLRQLDVPQPSGLEIRKARMADIPKLMPLVEELQRHLAAAPTFLPLLRPDTAEDYERFLNNPDNAVWIAFQGRKAVSYMQYSANATNASSLVRDKGTIAINGAYTSLGYRGSNVATALLAQIISYARENGFQRCSVDFEAQNGPACRFWLRHFSAVAYSLIRKIDDRIAWEHGRQGCSADPGKLATV